MKSDIVAIGELNVDIILNNIDGPVVIGKEVIASNFNIKLGSSTAIFAANCSALGSKVSFIGKIGKDDFGIKVLEEFKHKNVETSSIIIDELNNTGVTIVANYGNDRAMITYPGAMNCLTINDIKPDILRESSHVHFSSYFLQPGIRNDLAQLFLLAKELGLTTSLDLQWDPEEKWDFDYKNILPLVDVFFPNEEEIIALTKKTTVEGGLGYLSAYANIIVVKRGKNGSILRKKNGAIVEHNGYFNPEIVDAIGAGDSFNAGFIHRYIKGCKIEECLDFANLMGALNTTKSGGTGAFSSKEEIAAMVLEKFNIHKIQL